MYNKIAYNPIKSISWLPFSNIKGMRKKKPYLFKFLISSTLLCSFFLKIKLIIALEKSLTIKCKP